MKRGQPETTLPDSSALKQELRDHVLPGGILTLLWPITRRIASRRDQASLERLY